MPDRFSRNRTLDIRAGGTNRQQGFEILDSELSVLLGYVNTLATEAGTAATDFTALKNAFENHWKSATAPVNPAVNDFWLDTSTTPVCFKICTAVSPVTWAIVFYVADNGGMVRSFGVPALRSGTDASKVAGQAGSLYIATDTRRMYRDNGTSFDPIGGAYIVSASVPTDVWEGLMWLDTTTYLVKLYSSGSWFTFGATYG